MGEDMNKLALVHLSLGFQFYLLAFAFAGFRLPRNAYASEDDAIQAFLIIGFVVYTTVWLLTLLLNFGELKGNKNATIATVIMAYAAVACILIALCIAGSITFTIGSYGIFAHCMGLILGFIGAIFLTLPFFGVSST